MIIASGWGALSPHNRRPREFMCRKKTVDTKGVAPRKTTTSSMSDRVVTFVIWLESRDIDTPILTNKINNVV